PLSDSVLPRPPPRPPLFPYTTLFRSRASLQFGRSPFRRDQSLRAEDHHEYQDRSEDTVARVLETLGQGPKQFRDQRDNRTSGEGDRKSTRLNSSHVAISYAVFCLKKK